jgi:hypothetical protein
MCPDCEWEKTLWNFRWDYWQHWKWHGEQTSEGDLRLFFTEHCRLMALPRRLGRSQFARLHLTLCDAWRHDASLRGWDLDKELQGSAHAMGLEKVTATEKAAMALLAAQYEASEPLKPKHSPVFEQGWPIASIETEYW